MSSGYIEQMLIKTGNSPAEIKQRSRSHWIALANAIAYLRGVAEVPAIPGKQRIACRSS